MKKLLLTCICLAISTPVFAINVGVSSPQPSSTVSSPVRMAASASSGYPITGWRVYVDGVDVYSASNVSSINGYVNVAPGSHQVVIRAWDSSGAYDSYTTQITVTTSTTSPSGVVLSNINPQSSSTVSSPVNLAGSAASKYPITGWRVYVNGVDVYSASNVSTINTNVSLAPGTHKIVFRAWDSSGAYGDYTSQITVGTGNGLPTPPSNAKVFTDIDQMTGWGSCNSPECAGGSGSGTYWMALNQTLPSMDGNSVQFYNSGVWANSLWWKKLDAHNWATNFLWDFYFYVDEASLKATQTLEFDVFQFIDGYNYMIGSQCNYAYGVWDIWDEASVKWIHTDVPCEKFKPGQWHRIQWYVQRVPNTRTYKYVTLVVNGKSYDLNITRNARYLNWGYNLGVQYQLDVNASGAGFRMWVDKSKLTIW